MEPDNELKQIQGIATWTIGCFVVGFLLMAGATNEVAFGVGGPIIAAGVIRMCQGFG